MTTFLLTFAIVVALFAAMSVGVILGRKPITGSCGGMSALGMDTACEICGGDRGKCEPEQRRGAADAGSSLAYDAMSETGRK